VDEAGGVGSTIREMVMDLIGSYMAVERGVVDVGGGGLGASRL